MSKGLTTEERARLEDVGFMSCMTLVLLGNYAQTGHFGGPLAYTPVNVAMHLAGPDKGGLRYDIRRPKHPFGDKFMMAAGHSVPTCYALWMVLGQAMERRFKNTNDKKYYVDPEVAILPIDALGFRRNQEPLKTLLQEQGLADNPLFAQAKARGIKALAGHAEFAMTEGHAQEVKTQAMAMQVGKRLRIVLSDNNAGIDDSLLGGVISNKLAGYSIKDQWTSYGWNVISVDDGADYGQIVGAMSEMEDWDAGDRRPMIAIAKTTKGYWPGAVNGGLGEVKQITGYKSHPYSHKMNSEYFIALAESFEKRYGIQFEGIRDGAVSDTKQRLVQFKTNIDKVMSVLDQNGLQVVGRPPRDLRGGEVDELRHRQPFRDVGGRPVGIHQCPASRRRSRKRAMSAPPSVWSASPPPSIPPSSPASGRCRAPMAPSRR